ncbi:MAG TPA: hypothetical protein VGR37_19640 [Longimicrobiaceae bacterium]|nr:hypothetical protein [Longimicrobiaceae bacterium]
MHLIANLFGRRKPSIQLYTGQEMRTFHRLAGADFQVAVPETDLQLVAQLCSAAEKAGDPEFREATLGDIRRIVAKYL